MAEKQLWKINGFIGILLAATLIVLGWFALASSKGDGILFLVAAGLFILALLIFSGLTIVHPNEAKVFTFFGLYLGVIRKQGFWMTIPFTLKRKVSLRVINFNSKKLKVNDLEGNPIEIAAVVVYRVNDAAKAVFDVEDYEEFVQIQSETGIRHIASQYPYDYFGDNHKMTLRQHSDKIAQSLAKDLHSRLELAGVEVIESRIMHLAYSSEIASAMLQRQQAQAVLSARQVIVDGAVGMVETAINQLTLNDVVELDEEKKAQMVNNLMVALISDKGTQPIINSGSIY
ncbi:SPFH domain-containing protein [Cytobacillus sp. IB215665]|uniref:SPFH domain-containing protein n=1 Tax=Cytobacillus sp. IB215665 TaxID=3097357 RepID=UPI002A179B9D|nr:SPFH domain-containing protein [Cytobacillus sp. IB215665]MDX8365370.1 SPFH domain-containing protein [Cytobacillus sp. IB215665]